MSKNKEKKLKSLFCYNEGTNEYSFQLKRKLKLWWLFLLLLPLLLLIPLKRDIMVITQVADDTPEPNVDVAMKYTAEYLLWQKQFLAKVPYDTVQRTDSLGRTVFKDVGYSVYSLVFHFKNPIVFSVDNECFEKIKVERRFHTTRKVVITLTPIVSDVRFKIVDAELGFELPDTKVECEFVGRGGNQKLVDTTDANGCVLIKDVVMCGAIIQVKASADGYADTLLTDLEIGGLLGDGGGQIIPLRPLKDRFTFFVKNKWTKEPIPDALAGVTLTYKGVNVSGGKSRTNVDGMGRGYFDDARLLAKVDIKAEKRPNYKPGKLEVNCTVREFKSFPDSLRVVWLEPEPYTVQFRVIDTLSGEPIVGVRNKIVIDGVDGTTRTNMEISNRNGYFPVTAVAGDKITIESMFDPYYHPKTTVIERFEKEMVIYMCPVLVSLEFRTVEEDGGRITGVLPDCDLKVSVDGKEVSPNNSGTGQFTIPNLRLTSRISIEASKLGYESNTTKVKDKSVEQLGKSSQDERDIPLLKNITLSFRTVELMNGDVIGLLPDCDLVIKVDGKKVAPTNSGIGEFVVEDLRSSSIISIVASKQYYDSNDTKVRNRNVGDLYKAPQDARDIPLEIERSCGKRYVSRTDGNASRMKFYFLHSVGKSSGKIKFTFDTYEVKDSFELWNCKPDVVGKDRSCLLFVFDGISNSGASGPEERWFSFNNGPYVTVVATRSESGSDFEYQVCCADEDCDWFSDKKSIIIDVDKIFKPL